jgi:hypothetical protein
MLHVLLFVRLAMSVCNKGKIVLLTKSYNDDDCHVKHEIYIIVISFAAKYCGCGQENVV